MQDFNPEHKLARQFCTASGWLSRTCWILLLGIAASMLLGGCSAIRLTYNNLDTITYWWLDGYLDFHGEQKAWARQRTVALLAWHKQSELKATVQFLDRMQHELDVPPSRERVLANYDALIQISEKLTEHALPDMADLCLRLDADNLAQMEKKFAANNESFKDDYLDENVQERQTKRFKKLMEQTEFWFGSFSPEQERQLRAVSDARPLKHEMWLSYRLQRQADLLALLRTIQREHPGRDEVMARLRVYLDASYFEHSGRNPEEQAFFLASKQGTADFVVMALQIATPAQKERARHRLQQWHDDLASLIVTTASK